MKNSIRIALSLCVLAGLSAWNFAQETGEAKITVLVPEKGHEETALKIGSLENFAGGNKGKKEQMYWKNIKGEETRVFKLSVPAGGQKFKVEALIQPNNYEKITRYREITLKPGDDVKVDLTAKLPTDRTVARWVPTADDIVDDMCKLAKVTKDDVVYDLGCGDAVMLVRPIQKFGAKRGVGIDIDPKMVARSKEKVKEAGLEKRIEIRKGDILDVKDMSDATVVLLYIGDVLGERLSPVLRKTLKPGSRIVSHRFKLGDWEPTKTIHVVSKIESGYETDLHLWIVGEDKTKD